MIEYVYHRIRLITTRQIRCALELASTLNYAKAAERLGISQPALSYQITSMEEDLGFRVFDRTDRRTSLTPAGMALCGDLQSIIESLNTAVERAQNISRGYRESISLCIPGRSSMIHLPEIMERFDSTMPSVNLDVMFEYGGSRVNDFVMGRYDIVFAMASEIRGIRGVEFVHLFDSRIFLVTRKDDPLASRDVVSEDDLKERVMMVNGSSPPELKRLQERIVSGTDVRTVNCPDVQTGLCNVAAGRSVSLSPGLGNDRTGEFSWTPFETDVVVPCGLAVREGESRESVRKLVDIAVDTYSRDPGDLLRAM